MHATRLARLIVLLALLLGGGLVPAAVARAAPARAEVCFAQTGFCVQGRFLDHWLANGGLARNGFPLTGERRERLEDGRERVVQYFERVRLEYHPENAAPDDVLLGQLGRRVRPADPPVPPITDPLVRPRYFPETGHNLADSIRGGGGGGGPPSPSASTPTGRRTAACASSGIQSASCGRSGRTMVRRAPCSTSSARASNTTATPGRGES